MCKENELKTYVVREDLLRFVLGIIISSNFGVALNKEIIKKNN